MSVEPLAERLPDALPENPFSWLRHWLDYATEREVQRNPNAMTLASVGPDGAPSARVVLCKSLLPEPGYVVFFTNYRSRKCSELFSNPRVCAVFHWDSLGRQARLEGIAVKSPQSESDAYFASRDRGSQVGAWASDQSHPIASREALLEQLAARAATLSTHDESPVPRPPHWGGIRLWASAVELWIEGADRLHDRARWERDLGQTGKDAFSPSAWNATRLQP